MPKPTVGRIVHYFGGTDPEYPQAAIVTRVWGESCVNLHVFGDGGSNPAQDPTSVCQRDEQNRSGVWDWPLREG